LTLEQAIRTALTHRAELRGAENLVESAQGLRKQAAALPNPRVVYQSENLRSGMDFGGNVDTYAYASQVLEISGKRGARIGLAQTGLGRAELNRDLLQRDISFAVAQAFWDAVRISYLCKLTEENEGFFREILDYHQKRFEEGKIAAVDVMRVRLESAKAQSRGEATRLAKVQAMQKLAQEMGMPAPGEWTLNADFETLNDPRSESLAEKSFEQRADVKLARQAAPA
jgi:cobalt-zinc-cadmium efflux system outer membrane protein